MAAFRVALFCLLLLACACNETKRSDAPLRVAVAANFTGPAHEIAKAFERSGEHRVTISTGSTGKLTAQIENGAPYGVFLAADQLRPARLEASGKAVNGTRFTYAVGKLALYGKGLAHPKDGRVDLRAKRFRHLAIANPETAPYGAAAEQVLRKLGLWDELSPRIVRGENIAQAQQHVESGAAELGFVALSAVTSGAKHPYWVVPAELHDAIRQDAVLLTPAADDSRARAFLEFLRGAEAKRIIVAAGYATE